MAQLLFSNNAQTTLAGPISSTALSVAVASGSGVEFPSPGANQYFVLSLTDAATQTEKEIVWVTAKSGDVFTIVRAQENTTAQAWNAGDLAWNGITAGQMQTLLQNGLVNVQTFDVSGTYFPTANTSLVIVETVGGGGASGSCASNNSSGNSVGGGGQAGSYVKALFTSGFTGGIAITIGAGGAPAAAGNNPGGNGGTTSFGSLISCPGGYGGSGGASHNIAAVFSAGTAGGNNSTLPTVTGAAAEIVPPSIGNPGGTGIAFSGGLIQGGLGGSSPFGVTPAGGTVASPSAVNPAVAATNPGCGASGPSSNTSATSAAGAVGAKGRVVIWEYS